MTSAQLGFDALLASAAETNHQRQVERATGHLPATMEDALPFYRDLLVRHDAAMRAPDVPEVMRLREEANKLALRLNHGDPGILADDEAPGYALMLATATKPEAFPLWGQRGKFRITVGDVPVCIAMDGMFGIGMSSGMLPGFSAYAIDDRLLFLSETGYRSFLGIHAELVADMTPETFARQVVASYISSKLHGRLVRIRGEYQRVSHTEAAS